MFPRLTAFFPILYLALSSLVFPVAAMGLAPRNPFEFNGLLVARQTSSGGGGSLTDSVPAVCKPRCDVIFGLLETCATTGCPSICTTGNARLLEGCVECIVDLVPTQDVVEAGQNLLNRVYFFLISPSRPSSSSPNSSCIELRIEYANLCGTTTVTVSPTTTIGLGGATTTMSPSVGAGPSSGPLTSPSVGAEPSSGPLTSAAEQVVKLQVGMIIVYMFVIRLGGWVVGL